MNGSVVQSDLEFFINKANRFEREVRRLEDEKAQLMVALGVAVSSCVWARGSDLVTAENILDRCKGEA